MTRVEDALAAARLGADAIGMIFHDRSARNVGPVAREIVGALPPFVTPVGVFVDFSVAGIIEVGAKLGLRLVQLNGDYRIDALIKLAGAGIRSIEALKVEESTLATRVAAIDPSFVSAIVLETAATGVPGGSGVANNWDLVRRHQSEGTFSKAPPIIAAGGLTPENVGEVVRTIRPWAVDVSSGVEVSKGIKSPERIEEFIAAVRDADRPDRV